MSEAPEKNPGGYCPNGDLLFAPGPTGANPDNELSELPHMLCTRENRPSTIVRWQR